MRICSTAALVLALVLVSPRALCAQTAEAQCQVDTRLALSRLAQGARIGESLAVLATAPVEVAAQRLERAQAAVRRFFQPRPPSPAGRP
jgi:hypothetical protein